MALVDLPTPTPSRTRDEHIADHARLHGRTRGAVHSGDYATLQAAVDDANAKNRPLVIAPGGYVLSAPLRLDELRWLDIFAHGAILQAGGNMAAIVEVHGCRGCTWHGGRLKVPSGLVVDNALYIYHDTASCTRNAFYNLTIEGDYNVGVRIGKLDDGGQCDHMYFVNLECIGRELDGQIGIYVGTGRFANCLNHTFRNVMLSGHDTHVVASATNAYFDGVFMDRSNVDWYVATTMFNARNIRSESAGRMLVTGGPATYAALLSFDDVIWHGDSIAQDGEFIRTYLAGSLRLRNISMRHPLVTPILHADPGAPLVVDIDGFVSESDAESLLDGTARVTMRVRNYVNVAANGSVVSVEDLDA